MKKASIAAAVVVLTFASTLAWAHVTVASGPAFANTSQEITFSVGHGEDNADTSSVRIEVPASVASVKAERSDFSAPAIETDNTGVTTAVSWHKPDSELLPADYGYYKLTMRVKVPNAPFTTVYFPAHQVCMHTDGGIIPVDWVGTTAADADAGIEPAPALIILPARQPGWNRFTVPVAVSALSTYFSDAQIVWKGTSAYSANPNTASQIGNTSGVFALTALAAGDEIWVKY
ncbi:MAG: DUF1775 domain-containing protein [Myxococcaceae bacterium]